MIPNDAARCLGALMEVQMTQSPATYGVVLHAECESCLRRIDVAERHEHPRIDAPLGLLAEPDALCSARQNKP